ncbi:hypothetical protein [Burkholderia sp. TSV86]|uniref:hypothetical protein n=1 Tax=Burkholderia sp. TSV86 TaxID=1385594 RepID=UPI0018D21401|nr:hypothetical protein [Burkholderia sp. TSV86]
MRGNCGRRLAGPRAPSEPASVAKTLAAGLGAAAGRYIEIAPAARGVEMRWFAYRIVI